MFPTVSSSGDVSWTGQDYRWDSSNQRELVIVRDPAIEPQGVSQRSGNQQLITDSAVLAAPSPPAAPRLVGQNTYPLVVQLEEEDYRDYHAKQLVLFIQSVALDETSVVDEELYLTVGGLPLQNRQRLVQDDAAQLADTNIVCKVPKTGVYEDQGGQNYRVLLEDSWIGQLSFRLQTRTGADLSTLVETPAFALEFYLDARVYE